MFELVIPYITEPVELLKIVNFWRDEEQQQGKNSFKHKGTFKI